MTATRAQVVAEARSWIGTPFQHQARVKGVGVDCAGVVICVARTLGLVSPHFDVQGYARQPDGHSLLCHCDQTMRAVPREAMQPGDVVVVSFDRDPGHVGIVGDYTHGGLSIIHALGISARKVVETRLLFTPGMRFAACYQLPGVV